MLGGFFGRHFPYESGNPFSPGDPARAGDRPVKVLWSREEEFARDGLRPLSFSRFRAALDGAGNPTAIEVRTVGEGPIGRYFGALMTTPVDPSAVEGLVEKPYAIPNRRMTFAKLAHPVTIAFRRSVGHSMNDAFYESFLDEVALAGGHDPFAVRLALLRDKPRSLRLLREVAGLAGGWRRGPYEAEAEGGRRARGVALASPFGSETATIAEVSVADGEARVHNLWIAFDPGSVVNPAIVKAQVESAAALGTSSVLFERVVYRDGLRQSQDFDTYPILRREHMPAVHVRIVESGAPMGGVGEPGLPGVPPAILNAVAAMTGQRIRSLPLANTRLAGARAGAGVRRLAAVDTQGIDAMTAQMSSTTVTIEHVTLRSPKSFEAVQSALEASVPSLDHAYAALLLDGKVDEARDLLERQAPLSIFGFRDHGGLLLTAGLTRKAIQYDIGNPLTAARMTRHALSAALYAPIRVLLREDADGGVAFEYDRPATTFGQLGMPEVGGVAADLDEQLRSVLAAAAG